MHDYHAHTNYSDGEMLPLMVRAAAAAGLEGIGFADHCNVGDREHDRSLRERFGWTMDATYERRRRGIERQRERGDLAIHDAVEMDYDPRDETRIRAFLDDADFDYAIGSVHELDDANVQMDSNYAGRSGDELDALVDTYFDKLVALVESDLFAVAAHPDLVERTPSLRGRAIEAQYDRVARAVADSRTVPEVNAGRALTDSEVVHPSEGLLEAFREYDVAVTVGTDSHRPDEIEPRASFLAEFVAEADLTVVAPPGLDR